jgi:hypothetical protein
MKPVNNCYHLVLNAVPYSLLSKNIKIKIYRTIILPVVSYGYKTWSLTLREECRVRLLENRVLKRIFESRRDKIMGSGENYIMRSLMIIQVIKMRRMRWAGHVARMGEMCLQGFGGKT